MNLITDEETVEILDNEESSLEISSDSFDEDDESLDNENET